MKTAYLIIFMLLGTLTFAQPNTNQPSKSSMKPAFEFPALPYAYDALEPYIDKMTMEIHYSKHHRAYYDNFMKAIAGTEWETKTITDIFAIISKAPMPVRNNAGGYYNHTIFWENMAPAGQGGEISVNLMSAVKAKFGSFDDFKKQFSDAGKGRFGSGWAWLCSNEKGEIFITSTPNQDNPLMDVVTDKGSILLALDVWEHAYYLKYQNKRADYIDAFWNVVNWKKVNERYEKAVK